MHEQKILCFHSKSNSDFGRQMAVNIFDLHQMATPLITCTVPYNK